MRIFKNHYSAVFVFILTGLFFLPANGNSDVVVDPSMSNAPMSGDTSGTLPTADNSAAPINEGRDMDVGSHRAAPIGDAEESGGPAAQHMNREINDGGFGANSGADAEKARIAAEAQAAEQAAQAEADRLAKEEADRLAAEKAAAEKEEAQRKAFEKFQLDEFVKCLDDNDRRKLEGKMELPCCGNQGQKSC